jgi:ribosomal protein S18 acetylase RimI-like enzyme
MLEYLKIPTSNSRLGRSAFCQTIVSLMKAAYVILVNLRFLGQPEKDNLLFLLSAYNQVFHENLSRYHQWFYYLFGQKLMHIYEYEGTKAGFGLFRINPIWTMHMCKFGILDQFQGKGLAKVFLRDSLNHWQARGFKRFSVYVDPLNPVAKRSYESVGFKPLEVLRTQIYMEIKL